MSDLFKINKGLKQNLPTTYTAGHCYVTTDEGLLYIDTDNTATGRIILNALKAEQDSDGNIINNSYLKLTGGTLTGMLTIANGGLTISAGNVQISATTLFYKTVMMYNNTLQFRNSIYDTIKMTYTSAYNDITHEASIQGTYTGNLALIVKPNAEEANDRRLILYDNSDMNYALALRDYDGTNSTIKYILHTNNIYDLAPQQKCYTLDILSLNKTEGGFGNHTSAGSENGAYMYYPVMANSSTTGNKTIYSTSGYGIIGRNSLVYTDSAGTEQRISGMVQLEIGNDIDAQAAKGYCGGLTIYNEDDSYSYISRGVFHLTGDGGYWPGIFIEDTGNEGSDTQSVALQSYGWKGARLRVRDAEDNDRFLCIEGPQIDDEVCISIENDYAETTNYMYHTGNITYSIDQPVGKFKGQLWLEPID